MAKAEWLPPSASDALAGRQRTEGLNGVAHKLQHQALWISGFEKRKRHVQDNVAATKVHTRQQILWQADSENPLSRAHSKSIAALTRANECIRMASSGSQRGGSVGGDSIGNTGREGTKGSGSAQRLRALLPSTPGGPYKRPPSPTGPGGPRKQKRTAVPAACESAAMEIAQSAPPARPQKWTADAPSLEEAVALVSSTSDIAAHGVDDGQERVDEPMIRPQLRPGESSGHDIDWQPTEIDVARWTGSKEDDKEAFNGLLTHLLSLFWTWDNTVSPIIDRCMFLEDLQSDLAHSGTLPPGAKQLFCTPFLVNCVLAVACLYTTNPNVYSVPSDSTSRGRSFAEKSKRLLQKEPPSLTKLQGICLLWLWESCAGDIQTTDEYMETYFQDYMRLELSAMEIPSDFKDWDSRQGRELQALSHIIWGMYFTHAKMTITFQTRFRSPQPRIRQLFADKDIPHISDTDMAHWWPYPVNDSRHLQPSHYRRLLVARCEFSTIIEEANSLLSHGRFKRDPITMEIARRNSEDCYWKLIHWKADLPEYLKAEYSTLPVVILLHTLYNSALIEVLNPLMEHYYDDTAFAQSSPKQLRLAANFSLIHHVCTYRVLYSAKYEYSILQACLKAATTALYDLNDGGVDIFLRACQGLYEAGEFLKLANTFLAVTKGLIEENKLVLPRAAAIVVEKFYPELRKRPFTPFKEDGHLLMYWPQRVVDHEFAELIKRAELLSIDESPSR
ncbi:hypothetical protein M0657_009346 [Pyricularia oryzae]|nr:hypothetical protein M0657_009346 [Pyricularia oryzae]KAI7922948.1 hypothetical protein M9X92_004609 [Pyricularia oryzae]